MPWYNVKVKGVSAVSDYSTFERLVAGLEDGELADLRRATRNEQFRRAHGSVSTPDMQVRVNDRVESSPPKFVVFTPARMAAKISAHMGRKGWRFVPGARVWDNDQLVGRNGQWVRQCPNCGLERNSNYFTREGNERGVRAPWCDPCLEKRGARAANPVPCPEYGG